MNMKNYNSFAILAAMAMAEASAFPIGMQPIRTTLQETPIKKCMLPSCERERYGNYLYCCAEHSKEHQAMKKAERNRTRK